MAYIFQQALNALQLGSIYALIALGYTMVYGILTMINFAHGDLFMVGAFFCFLIAVYLQLSFVPTLLLSMLGVACLGVVIERLAYKPLRNAPRVSAIITALGVGLFLENFTLALSALPQTYSAASGKYHLDGRLAFHFFAADYHHCPFAGFDADSGFYCPAHQSRHGHARHFLGQDHCSADGRVGK